MPFTDLDEHLAEAFGEYVAEIYLLRPSKSPEAYRTPQAKARQNMRRSARRTAQTAARWMVEMISGVRPTSCRGPECHNLLSPKPRRAVGIVLYCCRTCSNVGGRRRRSKH